MVTALHIQSRYDS